MFSVFLTHLPAGIFGIILGIIIQHSFSTTIETSFFVLICSMAILLLLTTNNKHIGACVVICISCATGTYINNLYEKQLLCYERLLSNHRLTVKATVVDKNSININNTTKHTQLIVQIEQFRTVLNPQYQTINTRVALTTHNTQTPSVGDTILIKNFLCTKPSETLHQWFRKNNLTGYAYHLSDITVLNHPLFTARSLVWRLKHRIQESIQSKLSPQAYSLFSMLFLGTAAPQIDSIHHQNFSYWGINHYLARAGLHLLIIILIINGIISIITTRFITKSCMRIGTMVLYYLLTWHNIPFIRSFWVFVAGQCCNLLRTPIDTLHLLNLTIISYLMVSPFLLFTLDFQLTFLITYALVLVSRHAPFKRY